MTDDGRVGSTCSPYSGGRSDGTFPDPRAPSLPCPPAIANPLVHENALAGRAFLEAVRVLCGSHSRAFGDGAPCDPEKLQGTRLRGARLAGSSGSHRDSRMERAMVKRGPTSGPTSRFLHVPRLRRPRSRRTTVRAVAGPTIRRTFTESEFLGASLGTSSRCPHALRKKPARPPPEHFSCRKRRARP